jgi:hypothetical protein
VPRGLLPALTVAACLAALLPAVPAAAADGDVTTTIERAGQKVEFTKGTVAEAWPLTVDAAPDRAAARFDLDGDGVDELIVQSDLAPDMFTTGGAILVRYHDGRVERLVPQSVEGRNAILTVGDFNGDGFGDLAFALSPAVWVFSGSAGGLVPESAVRLVVGVPNENTNGYLTSLSPGDVNDDGYDDLAAGMYQAVAVVRGGPDGLTTKDFRRLYPGTDLPPGAAKGHFGAAVALGDVTGDGHVDLVVGDSDRFNSSAVILLPGTASGPVTTGSTAVESAQLDTIAQRLHGFGSGLSIGEVTGDGIADVVVDASYSTVAGRAEAGVLVTLAGSAAGISVQRSDISSFVTAGVPGGSNRLGRFGSPAALGDFTGDSRPDLITCVRMAQVMAVIPNSGQGLTWTAGTEVKHPAGVGLGGVAAAFELNGGGKRELFVGEGYNLGVYRAADTGLTRVAAITAATFGAADLVGLRNLSYGKTMLPTGVALPVPAAGPAVPPVNPPVKQPRSRYDFDGDGKDEVVVGAAAGAIVKYSALNRTDLLEPRVAGGASLRFAAGDFNGDGYADLATGDAAENRDKPSLAGQGGVWVTYGGAAGLDYAHGRLFTQDTPGVIDTSEAGDGFGSALAAGDLNGDGRADLAVGAPLEDTGNGVDAGAVTVLYGSPTGVTTTGSEFFSQRDAWIPDVEERGDHFGAALAIGDVTGDKRGDLAIGSPGEDAALGSVTLVPGSSGLSQAGVSRIVYSEIGRSTATPAALGTALAVADLNKDGKAEVIAGAPHATAGAVADAGQVVAFTGSASGITKSIFRIVHQDTVGAPGTAEPGDAFGSTLATGDISGDGYADLLVGSPNEATGAATGAGMVNLFPGSSAGVTGTGGGGWDQNSHAVPGDAGHAHRFGSAITVLNLDGADGLDALVGAVGEYVYQSDPNHVPVNGTVTEFLGRAKTLTPTTAWNMTAFDQTFSGYTYTIAGTGLGTAMLTS